MAPGPASTSPPRHAWDWFARQRLLWRGVHRDLSTQDPPVGPRYRLVDTRADVVACLRRDYPDDEVVRNVVHRRIDSEIFLGHAHRGLEGLGIRNAPRGLRWWWATITGAEVPETTRTAGAAGPTHRRQLALDLPPGAGEQSLDDVHVGWGD